MTQILGGHASNSFTSRSRGSGQWASGGSPARRRPRLSRTELAGRGAGRGGWSSAVADRADLVGRAAGGDHDRLDEAVPGGGSGVGDVEGARSAGCGQPAQGRGEVGGEARAAVLVVDEGELAARVGLEQPQHRLDHVRAPRTAHPGGAGDGGPGRAADLVLAAELRPAVHRARVGGVPLDVRAWAWRRRTRSRSRRARGGPRPCWRPRRRCGRRARSRRRPDRGRTRRRRRPSRRRSGRRHRAPGRARPRARRRGRRRRAGRGRGRPPRRPPPGSMRRLHGRAARRRR